MFASILYFLFGSFRIVAGAVVGVLAVAFVINGDGNNIFIKLLEYFGLMTVALGLVAWGGLYFSVAGDRIISKTTFVMLAVLSVSTVLEFVFIIIRELIGDGSMLGVVLYAPFLVVLAWAVWRLFNTARAL